MMASSFVGIHGAARQHALALQFRRGGDDDDRIDALLAAGLEQQRDVDARRRARRRPRRRRRISAARCAEHRMHDLLELLDRRRVVHHARRQLCAIDLAIRGGAGKRGLDRRRSFAFIELMHGRIGVVHRHAGLHEQFGRGGFPHPDRAGQSNNQHRFSIVAVLSTHVARLTPRAVVRGAGMPAATIAAGREW